LIREAKQHRVFVLEDDYDFDFHYAHNPIVPMFATSQSPYFIYLGSFSKIISPLLRLGFVVGDSTLIWELAKERKIIDGFGNTFLEEALADMIHSGEISRLRRKSIKSYDDKRKYLANLLKNKLSRQVEFNLPDGGLAFWIKLKKHRCIDIYQELQKQQIFLPNPSRYVDQISKEEGIRIGFASIKKEEMDTLVDKLSSIINGL
ncbi:MAG: aminotransferase class I/II-fold pyridoxal phosphate-dependent enzyme, partial [Flavobacteriales bacterium]|nr:aminotransferase class I/II-fold pyridoxal phosphate-dependent enzyme [Flavobacteriales bacterium]